MSASTSMEKPLLPMPEMPWHGPALRSTVIIVLLSAVGLLALSRSLYSLWIIWTTDPLRSIGVYFPLISLALILWEVKRMDWKVRGTWWGLLPLALAILAGHMRRSMVMIIQVPPHHEIFFPPDSLTIFAYASGVVLLFGGTRLYRRSLFPLALLLCLNPVPHDFSDFVDVPLQYASAHVARSFAKALGQQLTPDQLRLMFTPDFGIYIAPGCDGIRGSITMGYMALITGYICRFRWRTLTLTVIGAVLLGYLFNFLRLCLLVIYYVIALHFPAMQNHGKNVDYGIGSCLFLSAVLLLCMLVLKVGRERTAIELQRDAVPVFDAPMLRMRNIYPRLLAFTVLVMLGAVSYAHAWMQGSGETAMTLPLSLAEVYPQHMGGFTLTRTWKEFASDYKNEIYDWAEYRSDATGDMVSIGISPVFGPHDAIICHIARGENPNWRGMEHFTTLDGTTVSFSGFIVNDGITQTEEISTMCSEGHCGEVSAEASSFGILFSRPISSSLLDDTAGRPLPVLIKTEIDNPSLPADQAKTRLQDALRSFVSSASLDALTGKYFKH